MMRCNRKAQVLRLRFVEFAILVTALVILTGCRPTPITQTAPLPTYAIHTATPVPTATPTLTPIPTATPDNRTADQLCADVDAFWSKDWPRIIDDLERLRGQGAMCGDRDPSLTLYPAYFNYGAALDAKGDASDAITAYRKALQFAPEGKEAIDALQKHQAFTPAPPTVCTSDQIATANAAIPAYTPQVSGGYAQVQGNGFVIDGQPFAVHGINYYPARAPWQRFLAEADPATMAKELDLISSTGFNTLRVFVYNEALFDCPGSGAVPKPAALARLDAVITLATQRKMRLIITLNDLPDLDVHPLYTEPQYAAAQTAFVVQRYRNEPAILAWDVRNEGDVDYERGQFPRKTVLSWLSDTTTQVRQLDPNHLITAGWDDDSAGTVSYVDFVTFHYYGTAQALQARVSALKAVTQKPILLGEIGYSTYGGYEQEKAQLLHDTLSAANKDGLAGWMVWAAFDFSTDVTCIPPACPSKDNGEHHFGLWHTDYTPKPAVALLQSVMGG